MTALPHLSLVIGGAASGKSDFAEGLVLGSGLGPVHVATAEIRDAEMAAKVALHRAGRAGRGWRDIEEPRDLPRALARIRPGEAALVDCATLWLTNLLLADIDIAAAEAALWPALAAAAGPVVVVSNEVGAGIVPDNALARRFRTVQGGFNRRLAGRAGLVVTVIAGLPLVLKGALP
ncbi:MAG: bifunctional adenosylcobinamide kinase/adenosylcobinamide-phosphate guanylyltransferase [Rubellimicrobium sp.]|nr:bifunctional adenosylcobinamide kinase/adenosylcobinamide-phosphate guanylyltransferase [Rubellimicrobium sp.]